jgi:hypothetical protein
MSPTTHSTHARQLLLAAFVVALLASVSSAMVWPPIGGPVNPPGGFQPIPPPGGGNQGKGINKIAKINFPPKTIMGQMPKPVPPGMIGPVPKPPLPNPPKPPVPPPGGKGNPGGGGKGGKHPGGHGHHGHHGTDVGAIIGGGLNLLGGLLSQPPEYHVYQGGYPGGYQSGYGQPPSIYYINPPVDPGFLPPRADADLVMEIQRTERELLLATQELPILEMLAEFSRRAGELDGVHPQHRAEQAQRLEYEYRSWLQRQPSSAAFARLGFASYRQQLQDPDLAWDQHRRVRDRLAAGQERVRGLEDHLERLNWQLRRR